MPASQKIRVRFAVEHDEQAAKITALLEALGYEAVRDLDQSTSQTRLRWAVTRLAIQARLTERERDLVELVLQGKRNGDIARLLEISKATVKWHMHNIFSKTGAATREALLREALQLGGGGSRAPGEDGEPEIEIVDEVDELDDDDDE